MKKQHVLEITALKKDLKDCNFECNFGIRKLQIKNQSVTLGVTLKKSKTLLYQGFNQPNVTLKVESYT